jgi:hypothetical protein
MFFDNVLKPHIEKFLETKDREEFVRNWTEALEREREIKAMAENYERI